MNKKYLRNVNFKIMNICILLIFLVTISTLSNKAHELEFRDLDKIKVNSKKFLHVKQNFIYKFNDLFIELHKYIKRKNNNQFHKGCISSKISSVITDIKKLLSMCLTFSNTPENKDLYLKNVYPYFLHKIEKFYQNFEVLLRKNLLFIEKYSEIQVFDINGSWYNIMIQDLINIKDLNNTILSYIDSEYRKFSQTLIPNIENYIFQFRNSNFLAIGDNIFNDEKIKILNIEFSKCLENTKMLLINYAKIYESVNKSINSKKKYNSSKNHFNFENKHNKNNEIMDKIIYDNISTIPKLEIFLSDMSNFKNLQDIAFSLYDRKSSEYQINCKYAIENLQFMQDLIFKLESMCEIINNKKYMEKKLLQDNKIEIKSSAKAVIFYLDLFYEFISIIKHIPNENKNNLKKNQKLNHDQRCDQYKTVFKNILFDHKQRENQKKKVFCFF